MNYYSLTNEAYKYQSKDCICGCVARANFSIGSWEYTEFITVTYFTSSDKRCPGYRKKTCICICNQEAHELFSYPHSLSNIIAYPCQSTEHECSCERIKNATPDERAKVCCKVHKPE